MINIVIYSLKRFNLLLVQRIDYFAVDFDKLGLTDNENPYGAFPPILARSMGRAALSMVTDYVGQYLERRRGKRSADNEIHPDVETAVWDKLHGGERYYCNLIILIHTYY
jgi:hypothetical protein